MIRVQKGKFSGREIYDIVVADAVLVTTRILFGFFFTLCHHYHCAIKIAPLKPVMDTKKSDKMKDAFSEFVVS